LTIVCGLLILHIWQGWPFALALATLIALLVLVSQTLAVWIERSWFGLAEILGRIVPPFVLFLVFFLFLVPIALVSKWFRRKDYLMIRRQLSTTWRETGKIFSESDMEKPW
jgi:hypothetical protein